MLEVKEATLVPTQTESVAEKVVWARSIEDARGGDRFLLMAAVLRHVVFRHSKVLKASVIEMS